jgi:NADH-quinone oxidoreductase subunit J
MTLLPFILIALLTIAGTLVAAMLRPLIHAALCLVVAFLGTAMFFILLGAEFVGLVQVLVYVGAVAVLIVFTILLTRGEDQSWHGTWHGRVNWGSLLIALVVFGALLWMILGTPNLPDPGPRTVSVREVGETLMGAYLWPLLTTGLLLTAALLGALVLVMEEKE